MNQHFKLFILLLISNFYALGISKGQIKGLTVSGNLIDAKRMSKFNSVVCCVANLKVFICNNSTDTISFFGWSCGLHLNTKIFQTFRRIACNSNFPTKWTFKPGFCDTISLNEIYIPIELFNKRELGGEFYYHIYPTNEILARHELSVNYWFRLDSTTGPILKSLEIEDKLYEAIASFRVLIPMKFKRFFDVKTYNKYYRHYNDEPNEDIE